MRSTLPYLPALVVLLCCLIYVAHFFLGGGASHLILDSYAYLQLSKGQQTSVPFNTRIAVPILASLVSSATNISPSAFFKLLTPAALLTTLLTLRMMIRKRGGSQEWQSAVLMGFGASLAATFGFTPVVVDPVLLVLFCLTVAALDSGRLAIAVAVACVGALTKEYGIVLGLVCSVYAYRRRSWKLASLCSILPAATLLIVVILRHSGTGVGFGSWPTFASHLLSQYQLSVFRLRGPAEYSKLLYMWSWCGVWPLLLVATYTFILRFIEKRSLRSDEILFGLMFATLPILLLGDWSRSLIVVVPFAAIVATASPLAKDHWFASLFAVGGVSTALARPFHGELQPPHPVTLAMTVISVVASVSIVIRFFSFAISRRNLQVTPGASREAVVP